MHLWGQADFSHPQPNTPAWGATATYAACCGSCAQGKTCEGNPHGVAWAGTPTLSVLDSLGGPDSPAGLTVAQPLRAAAGYRRGPRHLRELTTSPKKETLQPVRKIADGAATSVWARGYPPVREAYR